MVRFTKQPRRFARDYKVRLGWFKRMVKSKMMVDRETNRKGFCVSFIPSYVTDPFSKRP